MFLAIHAFGYFDLFMKTPTFSDTLYVGHNYSLKLFLSHVTWVHCTVMLSWGFLETDEYCWIVKHHKMLLLPQTWEIKMMVITIIQYLILVIFFFGMNNLYNHFSRQTFSTKSWPWSSCTKEETNNHLYSNAMGNISKSNNRLRVLD